MSLETFTIADARSPRNALFECVTGSRAYGTDTAESDEDIKGIYVQPRELFYALDDTVQVNDATNDTTFYEVGRFVELLLKNNPTVLEMLFSPDDTIRTRHPLMDCIRPELVLSKMCEQTFGEYAATQIKKARGLNKKIVNPMPERRKTLPEFCHVLEGQGSVLLSAWLKDKSWSQEECGLVKIPHMRDTYGIYHDDTGSQRFRGIWTGEDPSSVRTSSIPKELQPVGWMSVNLDGFKKHCREHLSYWDWVENRNEARYQTNQQHGQGYDSKNLMHTIRLLEMAIEIAEEGTIHVRRSNREFLMKIRGGSFGYEEILEIADDRVDRMRSAFQASKLPADPDEPALLKALVDIRLGWYSSN
jgi:hypothetical protein